LTAAAALLSSSRVRERQEREGRVRKPPFSGPEMYRVATMDGDRRSGSHVAPPESACFPFRSSAASFSSSLLLFSFLFSSALCFGIPLSKTVLDLVSVWPLLLDKV
jgi:hypothetical protein